jgi:hypothetical protein
MENKQLYWEINSNEDLCVTCSSTDECMALLQSDFESFNESEREGLEYTITPIWLTQAEYEGLPEA